MYRQRPRPNGKGEKAEACLCVGDLDLPEENIFTGRRERGDFGAYMSFHVWHNERE